MAHVLGEAYPPAAAPQAAVDPAKLRDEMHRLSSRLVRARESYDQDLLGGGDAEVPLEEQLAIIDTYAGRLGLLTEQLRRLDDATPAARPPQPSADAAPLPALAAVLPQPAPPVEPSVQPSVQAPAPAAWNAAPPSAPVPAAAPIPAYTGPGITNPDGGPLISDGTLVRTEEQAIGEYVRHAAEQRWVATSRPSAAADYAAVCDALLAALAHKHGVGLEDERRTLTRQVDARYRRDYG